MRHIEDALQKSIVRYWDLRHPRLSLHLVCVPNGGKRNAAEAAKFKQMGVRPGFPDLLLALPNRFYPFMGIELKTARGRQSEHQKEYQRLFEQMGAKYVLVRSLDEFIRITEDYLKYYDNDIPTARLPAEGQRFGGSLFPEQGKAE